MIREHINQLMKLKEKDGEIDSIIEMETLDELIGANLTNYTRMCLTISIKAYKGNKHAKGLIKKYGKVRHYNQFATIGETYDKLDDLIKNDKRPREEIDKLLEEILRDGEQYYKEPEPLELVPLELEKLT